MVCFRGEWCAMNAHPTRRYTHELQNFDVGPTPYIPTPLVEDFLGSSGVELEAPAQFNFSLAGIDLRFFNSSAVASRLAIRVLTVLFSNSVAVYPLFPFLSHCRISQLITQRLRSRLFTSSFIKWLQISLLSKFWGGQNSRLLLMNCTKIGSSAWVSPTLRSHFAN